MFKKLALVPVAALALVAVPGLALATTTTATPDFTPLTDYITACIPVGAAAIGIAIVAGLAFSILVRIGKKITGAA